MKKILLIILPLLLSAPFLATAASAPSSLVPCSGPDCTICSFFQLLTNIYNFIVWGIATPLAVLALVIGGVLLMISAGNPNLAGLGKKILYAAIIGLALTFGSFLIITFILTAMGYKLGFPPSISC